MALKKEAIEAISKLTKIPVAELTDAITATEEKEVTIPEKLVVFTEEEVTTLKANEYKAGKTNGVEMAVKEIKEKRGLEFTGKTIDGLLDAHSKKVLEDAKLSPDVQVAELNEKLKNIQKTVEEKDTIISQKQTELETERTEKFVFKHIPDPNPETGGLSKEDFLGLMKINGYTPKVEEGKLVFMKDGKPILDSVSNSEKPENVIKKFIEEKKLLGYGEGGAAGGGIGGRGGQNGKPAGYKVSKLSELKKEFEERGASTLGEEFQNAVEKAMADNKDFVMD